MTQTTMTKMPIIEPPIIMALLKTTPAVFLDEKPRKIKNAAKIIAIKDSAFIIVTFYKIQLFRVGLLPDVSMRLTTNAGQ